MNISLIHKLTALKSLCLAAPLLLAAQSGENLKADTANNRAGNAPAKLNVILMVIDDLGATDLGCTGSEFYQTPNIDQLAKQGLRFTHAYSACTVCSPTRAALLTGKYPARLHITDWIPGEGRTDERLLSPDWTMHLPLENRTLATAFREQGYATASIGKWHLGKREYYPDRQGFDINIAGTDKGQPPSYFSPYGIPTLPDGPKGEFLTDRESAEASKFIEKNRDHPFFLYLPHHAVHTPLMGKPGVIAKYRKRVRAEYPQRNAVYAALIESVDDSVGNLVGTLERLGLDKNTVVIFTSDNGGLLGSTYNLGMRAGKGSAFEGGVRVPFIVRWPGLTKPNTLSDQRIMSIDLYRTLLHACNGSTKRGQQIDGIDLLPSFAGGELPPRPLYWHYPHYHLGGATPYSAIIDGDYRLVEFFEDKHAELYDLKSDPLESHDLAVEKPDVASRLRRKLVAWRRNVAAQLPVKNPDYVPGGSKTALVDLD